MTIEMARLMMKSRQSVDRAKRLLNAILPHAIALETVELEQEILSLLEEADREDTHDSLWKTMMSKMQAATKRITKKKDKGNESEEQ